MTSTRLFRYYNRPPAFVVFCYVVLIALCTVGCRKDSHQPTSSISDFDITNTNWILHSGRVYMLNMDNGQKEYYDHFDNTKTVSCLDVINGSALPIDTIEQNLTTWHFDGKGLFTLNDSAAYGYTEHNGTYSIIGLENGSARPLPFRSVDADHFTVEIHEAYQSDGTYNYNYYSVITFLRQGTSCNSCIPPPDPGYIYQGTLAPTPTTVNDLISTAWVITRYDQGLTPYYPNDTLDFVDFNSYTINGGTEKTYSYSGIVGNNMKSLTLYDCTTFGGNYSGQVLNTFVDDWEFNNATFSAILGPSSTVKVWALRIN